VSAPILFYELLVIHTELITKRSAATVTRRPKMKARTCRASQDMHFFARHR
jgi:hypothetical protein